MYEIAFDEIMNSMMENLKGNYDEDMTYLINESSKYKKHKDYDKINEVLGGLTYDLLPDDEKEKIEEDYFINLLEKLTYHIDQNNLDETIVRVVSIIRRMEQNNWLKKRVKDYNMVNNVLKVYSTKISKLEQYVKRLRK